MCPNINNENVRNQFNSIIKAFGGATMTIEEFKSKELRNQRSGVDDSAMQIAYATWDKTNGSPILPSNIVEYCRSILSNPERADGLRLDESKPAITEYSGFSDSGVKQIVKVMRYEPSESTYLELTMSIGDNDAVNVSVYGYDLNVESINKRYVFSSIEQAICSNKSLSSIIDGISFCSLAGILAPVVASYLSPLVIIIALSLALVMAVYKAFL